MNQPVQAGPGRSGLVHFNPLRRYVRTKERSAEDDSPELASIWFSVALLRHFGLDKAG